MEGVGLLLHINAAVREDIAQLVLEDFQYRDLFFLLCITFEEQLPDAECPKKEEIAL